MPDVPQEAVNAAVCAYRHALMDRPTPTALSDEQLMREVLEAAAPVLAGAARADSEPDYGAFIAARLDEDQAVAREIMAEWPFGNVDAARSIPGPRPLYVWAHLDRHDPERVLRVVAALRAIVQWCILDASVETALANGDISAEDYVAHKTVGALVLRHIAAIWSDHPDYRRLQP